MNRKQFIFSGFLGAVAVSLGLKAKATEPSLLFPPETTGYSDCEFKNKSKVFKDAHSFYSKHSGFQSAKKALTLDMIRVISNLSPSVDILDYSFILRPLGSGGTIDPLDQRSIMGYEAIVVDGKGVKKTYSNMIYFDMGYEDDFAPFKL